MVPTVERIRVYRPRLWMRGGLAVSGLAMVLFGLWALITGYDADEWFAFVGIAGFGLLALIVLYREKIELTESTLRYGSRTIARADIVGFRASPFRIVVRSGKPLRIDAPYRIDAAFEAFLAGVPDLDAADHEVAASVLHRSPLFGATELEQRANYDRARRITWGFNALTAALCVASFVWPAGWFWAPLALLPFVGLAVFLAGEGRYALDKAPRDGLPELRPVLTVPLVFAPMALCVQFYRALIHLVEYPPFLLVGAVVGWIAGLVVHRSEERSIHRQLFSRSDDSLPMEGAAYRPQQTESKPRRGSTVLIGLAFAAGFASALAFVNARLDARVAEHHRVPIVRSICESDHASLELEPWGPIAERDRYTVYRRECARYTAEAHCTDTTSGSCEACISLHPGALGVPWYEIHPCDP